SPPAERVETPGSPLESGLDTIEQHFIQPLSRDQLETKALAALVADLDPYSHYLDAAEMDLFRADLTAGFGGIGVNLDFKDASGYPRITYLLYGGVAGAAGIGLGDRLLGIGGKDVKGQSYEQVSGALRGAVGSTVSVQVRREGVEAPLDFKLARVEIQMPSVRALRRDASGRPDWWLDRSRKLGYARIASLATDTAPTVDRLVAELQHGHAHGLVLDLRDCGGGLMRGALDTADLFLARGRMLTLRQRGKDEVYDATPGKYTRLPLVLLINAGTASSAEILAGALADNHRATLVGERSYGKGRIQVIYSLGEGRGGLVLSTGTFQRPNGKTIDRHDLPEGSTEAGIAPDIELKMSEAEHGAWLEFAEKTTGTLVLTPEEQLGAPPDPVLAKAAALLSK
ncbi:MAG: S41 family peptidase, partial [Arenimonas sp.]